MFGIIVSALNAFLTFLLRGAVLKFVVMGLAFYIVHELFGVVIDLLPTSTNLSEIYNMVPDSMIYFSNLMLLPMGLKIVFSSYLTRFIIRRTPFIG
ncbi:DUF2523 family protein [Escherichia coli]|uniref:DUF2523 family protein n=1 Tax=Escherichia coli TaxID=562 RepID=UPI002FD42E82